VLGIAGGLNHGVSDQVRVMSYFFQWLMLDILEGWHLPFMSMKIALLPNKNIHSQKNRLNNGF